MDNIAVICLKYPQVYSGYGNQAAAVFEKVLCKTNNIKFTVLTGNFHNAKHKEQENIIINRIGSKTLNKINPGLGGLLFGILCFLWLIKNANKFSIIHCISAHGPSALPAIFAGIITRKKVIVKITQAEYRDPLKSISNVHKLIRETRKKVVSKADFFISISQEIKLELVNYGIKEEKIINIPNGVEVNKYYPISLVERKELRIKLSIDPDAIVVLYAGSLNKRKGIYDLLDACKLIDNLQGKKIEIVLCGPDHENVYDKHIRNKLFPVNINYKGNVDNINEYYQAADIFILPSYSEGLPNVLLEAAMSGLALIASDIGGNRDIVVDGYSGLLYNLGDSKLLKEKILSLINDNEKRLYLSKNALKFAKDKFSLSTVSQQYINLYDKL
jgi:glycosyltransferase involved in cell wall biosynthesis